MPSEFQEIDHPHEPTSTSPSTEEFNALNYHLEDEKLNLEDSLAHKLFSSSENELDAPIPDSQSSPHPTSQPQATTVRPKPGWHIVLAPNVAPKDISSNIDESHILHTKRRAHLARALLSSKVPRTYREAMLSSDAGAWTKAIDAELGAMAKLKVWDIAVNPEDESLLGTVWVFRKKKDSDRVVVKFKARLCTQGSKQQEGYDFTHTYNPTGCSESLRAALITGLSKGYSIHQMDAKNAFLYSDIHETVYLRPPPGLSVPKGHCLKVNKAIYGLKQAPQVWYAALEEFFLSINFNTSPAYPCLFVSQAEDWECFVHVYVDDMIIISKEMEKFKRLISNCFCMEDLGKAEDVLGIKLTRISSTAQTLTQGNYTQFGMADCRTTDTPMVANTCLVKCTDEDHLAFLQLGINYREALGLLNYLAVSTRQDISFAVSQLLQHL